MMCIIALAACLAVPGSEAFAQSAEPLAWAAGGGIGFPVAPRLTRDVSYRYLDLGERRPILYAGGTQTLLTQDRADLQVHTIMIGLRYEL